MKNHPLLTKAALAILCITLLASIALFNDVNGALLATAMSAIAGISGFTIATLR